MREPSDLLRGRVAVITGATRGIGLHIAAAMAQAGANVVIASRRIEAVEAIYDRFSRIPGVEVLGWAADVTRYADVEALGAQAVARFGQIDIWVNNAGISGPYAATADIPPDRWRQVIETNLVGTFHGTYVALRQMLPRNQGKIINLVGAGAWEGARLPTFLSAYGSSKAGVLRFTQIVAEEYKGTRLSILALNPGMVRTVLTEQPEALTEEARASLARMDWVLATFGSPIEEGAALAVRMASSETDGITGKLYRVQLGKLTLLRRLLRRR
ncbi:MAG: SDR family oxidoreductase [Ardenticatenaceae bacterium]|nr:SDR family oxidoreductase [Ardenticatenaceae bacterium]HBY98202.1 NAD(P)-dependent oxidoreductase [Chloroflexota bacterium]